MEKFFNYFTSSRLEVMENLDGTYLGNIWFIVCFIGLIYSFIILCKYLILSVIKLYNIIINKLKN